MLSLLRGNSALVPPNTKRVKFERCSVDDWCMKLDTVRSPVRLTWIAAAFGCAASALAATIGADARWLAALGDAIVRAGAVPHALPYAGAPQAAWHDASALGQLVFYGLESQLGDRGLVLAQTAAAAIALGALALDMQRAHVRDRAGAGVLVAIVIAAPAAFFVVRAQLFSLALFPVLVLLLRSEAERPSRRIWLAVPLLALWANLHGGVLVGFAALASYLVLRRLRVAVLGTIAVLAASACALVATPAFIDTVRYYAGVLGGEAAATHYGLWAPLSLRDPLDLLFIALALPLVLTALRRRPATWELVVLVALSASAIESRRSGIWLLLFVAPPAALGLQRAAAGRPFLSRRLALVCGCVPALMLVFGLVRAPASNGAGERLIRQAAAAAHRTPILAEPLDAERLALEGHRIWIGNPLDAFPRADQRLYLDWLRGAPAGDRILQAPVRVVLVTRGSAPQLLLSRTAAFREIGHDAHAVLYGRN